ncbi:MAG: hypothetical protein O2807_12140 [bacterium]|nr:hypothetical protein [bacterium]
MAARRSTPDFEKSNRIPSLPYKPGEAERMLTLSLLATESPEKRQEISQSLLDALSRNFKVPLVRVRVDHKPQPHKMHAGRLAYKEYGAYYLEDEVIRIANLTAVKGKVVAGKTFLDTLIHEYMHHLDRKLLGIPSTPHSAGFYRRIEILKGQLMPKDRQSRKNPAPPWQPPPVNLTGALETARAAARTGNPEEKTSLPAAHPAREKSPAKEKSGHQETPPPRRRKKRPAETHPLAQLSFSFKNDS